MHGSRCPQWPSRCKDDNKVTFCSRTTNTRKTFWRSCLTSLMFARYLCLCYLIACLILASRQLLRASRYNHRASSTVEHPCLACVQGSPKAPCKWMGTLIARCFSCHVEFSNLWLTFVSWKSAVLVQMRLPQDKLTPAFRSYCLDCLTSFFQTCMIQYLHCILLL